MSTRKLLVLLGVFLALFAFVILFERHQPTTDESAQSKKRLLSFKPEDLTEVTIERPGLLPIHLTRVGTTRWRLEGKPSGPADSGTVDALVSDLSRMEILGEPRTSFDPKEFGLDAPKATATLALKGGEKKTVRFGKEVPGTDATAASEGNRFAAVKWAPLAQMTKPVDEFRSKALVEVPSQEITRITIVKGASKTILGRGEGKTPGEWRIESPIQDLAAQTFVDQLLSDFTSARVAEYVALGEPELGRVGLAPPSAIVTLQKGTEIVSDVAFGAAKAEGAGKIYAKRGDLVVVVDDRIQEDLGKEFTALRETRICPVDSWAVSRVSFESNGVRAGAERMEGEWRSSGHAVPAALPEELVEKIARGEARRFVAKKDYASAGIPVAKKGKAPESLAVYEVTPEKATSPTVVTFLPAAPPMVAVEVTGRSEAMLVDKALLDDLTGLAARLRASGLGMPTPVLPPTRTPPPPTPIAAPAASPFPTPAAKRTAPPRATASAKK
jgi:hypothetical protein